MQAASNTAEYEALSNLLQQAWTQAPHALVSAGILKHVFGDYSCASGTRSCLLVFRHCRGWQPFGRRSMRASAH